MAVYNLASELDAIMFFKGELLHHTIAHMHTYPRDAIKIPVLLKEAHVVITILNRY